jgi:hypothetical protein
MSLFGTYLEGIIFLEPYLQPYTIRYDGLG